jgi:hypothetical protein
MTYWSFRYKNAAPHNCLRVLPTLGMLLSAVNERDFKTSLFLLQGKEKWDDLYVFVDPKGNEYRALVRPPNVAIGAELPGDPCARIDAMMKEGLGQIKDKGKRPFEMLALEWDGLNAIGKMAYGVYPGLQSTAYEVTEHMSQVFMKNLGYGHNGPLYGPGFGGRFDQNSRHDVHVAYALANNEHIPEDVLREYKELAASKGRIWQFDCKWAFELLAKPWLRGEFTEHQLMVITSVLRHGDYSVKEITQCSLLELKRIVANLRPDFGHEEFLSALEASSLSKVWN